MTGKSIYKCSALFDRIIQGYFSHLDMLWRTISQVSTKLCGIAEENKISEKRLLFAGLFFVVINLSGKHILGIKECERYGGSQA